MLHLAKNWSTFCSCPETLWKAEFKSEGLINLEGQAVGIQW
jgi:hypothetical protein